MDKFDVFGWANAVEEVKNNVSVELFLFNKNYTPYKVRYSDSLTSAVKNMFMMEAVGYVNKEAGRGLEYREYGKSEGDERVIWWVALDRVGRAETLIHLIEKEYRDITYFSDEEHEFKKIRGVVAKFIYDDKVFYIVKGLGAGAAMAGKASWELRGESFGPMGADIAVRMPEDNQVLIAEGTVVIFNAGKFERLFAYDARVQALSEGYAREIEEAYGLSFPEGLTLNALLADKKPLVKKLEGVEIGEMKQEQVVDYADEMGLELMTDEGGKIIIMDEKDLAMFVGLLSEDYFVSPVSGRRYLVRSKKLLDGGGGEPPRG